MKKVFAFFTMLLVSSFFISLAFAASLTLTVDAPMSPVDANKVVVTGISAPGASVSVTGGTAHIAPVTADSTGRFSIEVALVQEATNNFDVKAELSGSFSDTIIIEIVEGVAAAQEYESSTGEDRTSPNKAFVDETEVTTEDSTYTIIGTAEADSTIMVTGAGTTTALVDSEGNFTVTVGLTGSGTRDIFTLTVKDAAGNISSGLKVYVTGTGDTGEMPDPNDDDNTTVDEAGLFSDMTNHWSATYVDRLVEMGAVAGYTDGTFRPDAAITRAEILKIALVAFDHDVVNESGDLPYIDVGSDDWFKDYVVYARDQEIVEGFEDGTFRPNDNVSRAAALKIIVETTGEITVLSVTPNFPDVDAASDWFAMYTAWALENGIVEGYEDGTYRAGQDITRGEASKIILEVLDFINAE